MLSTFFRDKIKITFSAKSVQVVNSSLLIYLKKKSATKFCLHRAGCANPVCFCSDDTAWPVRWQLAAAMPVLVPAAGSPRQGRGNHLYWEGMETESKHT